MLHEILLALSGHPTPLFNSDPTTTAASIDATNGELSSSSSAAAAAEPGTGTGVASSPPSLDFSLLTPSERALLSSLSHLAGLHTLLRKYASRLNSTHPSPTCRAIAAAIANTHLSAFQSHILSVEAAILSSDSAFVGANGIVPLSALQSTFKPWRRRLEWLWSLVKVLLGQIQGDGYASAHPYAREHDYQGQGHSSKRCTAKIALDYLRRERRTGYVDIQKMCLQLLNTAEKAWCRALAMWVLYGEIPGDALGMEDFFIREVTGDEHSAGDRLQETVCRQRTFEIKEDLMPDFVTPETAASILFIGKSLNALKASSSATTFSSSSSPSPSSALPTSSYTGADLSSITLRNSHTTSLSSLPSPISPTDLTAAVSEIRRSLLSQSPLLQLLPLPAILDILHLLHDYLLLNQGDFAVTLVRFADEVVKNRHLRPDGRVMKKHRDEDGGDDDEWDSENLIDSIRDLFVKPAEVEQVLAQTWAEMYALQGGDDTNDNGRLELARQSITLEFDVLPYQKKHHQQQQEQELHQQRRSRKRKHSTTSFSHAGLSSTDHTALLSLISPIKFNDMLFSTPLTLSLALPQSSPLTLLFPPSSLSIYASIHSYLLSLRRSHLHLSNLYRNTYLRRTYPSPLGPPHTNRLLDRMNAARRRLRENTRNRQMRGVWASLRRVADLLGLLNDYFSGEVVGAGWDHFRRWLCGESSGTSSSSNSSRPGTATKGGDYGNTRGSDGREEVEGSIMSPHDPESITAAHTLYLSALIHLLFLTDEPFTSALRELLLLVERYAGLIVRLGEVWYTLDLEENEGVVGDPTTPTSTGDSDGLDSPFAREEVEVTLDLKDCRQDVETAVGAIIERLRQIDDERLGNGIISDLTSGVGGGSGAGAGLEENDRFIPHRPAGVDTLLMKLDVGGMYSLKIQGGYEFGASLVD